MHPLLKVPSLQFRGWSSRGKPTSILRMQRKQLLTIIPQVIVSIEKAFFQFQGIFILVVYVCVLLIEHDDVAKDILSIILQSVGAIFCKLYTCLLTGSVHLCLSLSVQNPSLVGRPL
jgi:hypothetical protein